ncbi:MAG: protein kinase [Myxococcota bacterium]
MALQPGEILDAKYRIIRQLGQGSMGAVYEGENVRIRRRVAIKVLLPQVADQGDVVKRFEREAQAAGRIGSEHIVEVLDLGTLGDGGFYMVMEFLEGMTLGERIAKEGRLGPREIVPIAQQLLFGLEMAHASRVIHRDLKPDNVFLVRQHAGQSNFVKILDFGISKFNPLTDEEGMSMTRTGAVMGTPFYMAPEQAKGAKNIDHRSDLYAVGVILYQAVTGQVPFDAGTFNELIFKIVLEEPLPPERFAPSLDPAFGRIIRRAMAREPEQRFQSAAEFAEALSRWLHTGRAEEHEHAAPAPPIAAGVADSRPPGTDTGITIARPSDPEAGRITAVVPPRGDAALGRSTEVIGPGDAPLTGGTEVMHPDDVGATTTSGGGYSSPSGHEARSDDAVAATAGSPPLSASLAVPGAVPVPPGADVSAPRPGWPTPSETAEQTEHEFDATPPAAPFPADGYATDGGDGRRPPARRDHRRVAWLVALVLLVGVGGAAWGISSVSTTPSRSGDPRENRDSRNRDDGATRTTPAMPTPEAPIPDGPQEQDPEGADEEDVAPTPAREPEAGIETPADAGDDTRDDVPAAPASPQGVAAAERPPAPDAGPPPGARPAVPAPATPPAPSPRLPTTPETQPPPPPPPSGRPIKTEL